MFRVACWSTLWLALLSLPALGQSRYERTLAALTVADDAERVRFAEVALMELAEVYHAEADLARAEARQAQDPLRLLGWARAVEQYAEQLQWVMAELEAGAPVEIRPPSADAAMLRASGRWLILSHPRPQQQAALEGRILEQFCSGAACEELTALTYMPKPIPLSATSVQPSWQFTPSGAACSYRQLTISFNEGGNIGEGRRLCEQFFQEAETLAVELAWQQRHGVRIEWQQLQIRATPGSPEHLVTLNTMNDTVLARLPLLKAVPHSLQLLAPWLRQAASGDRIDPLQIPVSRLGWE